MWEFIKNPDTWLTIIPIGISIYALIQSGKQTRLSNKHQLFDRRIEKYLLLNDLATLYQQNRNLLIGDDDIAKGVSFHFALLTNCTALEKMCLAMGNPLQKEEQNIYLSKIEMLEKNALEVELVWKDKTSIKASAFIRAYKELLQSMYKQQVFINSWEKVKETTPVSLEVYEKKLEESEKSTHLLENIKKLDDAYSSLVADKTLEKLADSIKL